jgi:hypothetical protein
MFIGVMLAVLACARRISVPPLIARGALPVAAYAIGSVAAFWLVERLAGFAS